MISVAVGTAGGGGGEVEVAVIGEVGRCGVKVAVGESATKTTVDELVGLSEGLGASDKRGWQPTDAVNSNKANPRSPATARRNSTHPTLRCPLGSSVMPNRQLRDVNQHSLS